MSIPVDTTRFVPIATGNFAPVSLWEEKPDGSRVRSDRQATSETGVPLWNIEILRNIVSFGQSKTVPTDVVVPHTVAPQIAVYSPAKFENLTAEFYVSKGQIKERWTADAFRPTTPPVNEK